MSEKLKRVLIDINGIVQGVGFRPFVYKLAHSCDIKGWVNNYPGGVHIDAEGTGENVSSFLKRLKDDAPPLSYINTFNTEESNTVGYLKFEIRKSSSESSNEAFISADMSVCDDCLREMNDPANRRYRYPFINCTNCGPRFTITKAIPYDRVNTTMRSFPMCKDCANEYSEPLDRRFHAQPVACEKCGPSLSLLNENGDFLDEGHEVEKTKELLNAGKIVAIKGLGGYHLACDAKNSESVHKLRIRKNRDGKPFALMAKNIDTISKYCFVNDKEAEILKSPKKPIVLLRRKQTPGLALDYISQDNGKLGIMLPYTPLHYLIMDGGPEMMVMTSGNRSSEPIYYKDEDALKGLRGIADYFLVNNREIFIRTDDSVADVFRDRECLIRRSRGYVPFPTDISSVLMGYKSKEKIPAVLACGGELKNTFCITKANKAFLSHHIGDLENIETLTSFENGIEHFKKIFSVSPNVIACDKHPDYLSTRYADRLSGIPIIRIQHHHAHIASCMVENAVSGAVIGVAFDGTGYGDDGKIWGGEFFTGDYSGFERRAHFEYVPLPGGETGIKEPWRMAVSYLIKTFGDDFRNLKMSFLNNLPDVKKDFIISQIEKNINAPLTSSVGRLFDAISAMLGLCEVIEYEGQAAIRLENAADSSRDERYPYEIAKTGSGYLIRTEKMISKVVEDIVIGKDKTVISGTFHRTIAGIVCDVCVLLREIYGINQVALSGGVFQNRLLLGYSIDLLENNGFCVYTHRMVPTNDGGISLGQAVLALRKYMEEDYE